MVLVRHGHANATGGVVVLVRHGRATATGSSNRFWWWSYVWGSLPFRSTMLQHEDSHYKFCVEGRLDVIPGPDSWA